MATRRMVIEIELLERVRLEELFRGVKYRVVDLVAELEGDTRGCEKEAGEDR